MVEFYQNFCLFNTQSNRPRVSPASFKHVGLVLYSRGFKFGENGQIKIWVHFGLQVSGGWIWPKFLVFWTHNLIGLGNSACNFQACRAGPLLKGLQIWGKRADQIWVHFGLQVRGGWIWPKFLVFSTHNLIGLGPPLQVSSVSGRSSTQVASNLGKTGRSKFGSILASRSVVVEFDQNF